MPPLEELSPRLRVYCFVLALIIGIGILFYSNMIDANSPQTGRSQSLRTVTTVVNPSSLKLKDKNLKSQYVKGQFILKFKESLTEPADLLHDQGLSFRSAVKNGTDNLDRLNTKHRVKKIKPLFKIFQDNPKTESSRKEALAERKLAFFNQINATQARYPKRTRRAPISARIPDLTSIYLVEVPAETDVHALCTEYVQDPNVEYCQPNYLAEAQFVPNDPYYLSSSSWGQPYEDLWDLKKIQSEQAWDLSTGQGIVVAVVDTGLDYNHPDIAANVWTNPGEIPGNGIDDDGNGYIDDVRGWDFVGPDSNNPVQDNDPMDGYGHGTHVAGTIAAVGNNGLGVIGVAYNASIMPVKGLDDQGSGTFSELAEAIVYAAMNGADVINNSWGCGGCSSDPLIVDAVGTAHGLGSVVVFAAGNNNGDVKDFFPANLQDVLTVAATDAYDAKSSFSNWGFFIDVAAPGGGPDNGPPDYAPFRNILSLKAQNGNPDLVDPNLIIGTDYLRQAGTSMAAPHVSGVVALVLARNPNLTRDQVMSIIKHTAQDQVGDPSQDTVGYDSFYGWGRLNAMNAVASAFNPPPDPPVLEMSPIELVFDLPKYACPDSNPLVDIFNVGGGILNWTASAPSWLIPVPAAGTTPSTISIKPNTTQSQADILRIQSMEAANSPADIPVSVDISPFLEMIECNVSISQAFSTQSWYPLSPLNPNPPGIPDDLGGAIYVWVDTRNGKPDLFMQRIHSSGQSLWQADGIALALAAQGDAEISPAMISDGVGGAIIAWEEGPNSWDITAGYIKAQRVNSSGQPLWGSTGALISGATNGQTSPTLVPDGIGGAVVAWTDDRNAGGSDIYAQRVSANGVPLWAQDGVPVTQAADSQFGQVMATDGSGGAIIAWTDRRTGFFTVYAQRIDAQGNPKWATDGIRIGSQDASDFATILEDGNGGAIIVWMDYSGQSGFIDHYNIFGQRVDASGQNLWSPNGAPILTGLSASGGMFHPDSQPGGARLISDGKGGIILSWLDDRNGNWDIYAQRVRSGGSTAWTVNGVPIVTASGTQMMTSILPDQEGGAFFAWFDERAENGGLYIQRISATGQPLWTVDGILVQAGQKLGDQVFPNLVPLAGNRLLLSWDDWRNCSDFCYGTELDMLGRVMEYGFQSLNHPPTLNPIGPKIVNEGSLLTFTISGHDSDGDSLTYSTTPLPSGASFNSSTGSFSWTPETNQSGSYTVTFAVSDGLSIDTEDVTITVVDVFSTLTVTKLGTGSGSVTSDLPGINCGTDCSETYTNGTSIRLAAVPNGGSTFAGWSGDCAGTGECAVMMTQSRNVTATFIENQPPPVASGDLDASGRVDGFDLGRLGLAFGSQTSDTNWNPDADLNEDGVVDGSDLTILIANFGKRM